MHACAIASPTFPLAVPSHLYSLPANKQSKVVLLACLMLCTCIAAICNSHMQNTVYAQNSLCTTYYLKVHLLHFKYCLHNLLSLTLSYSHMC